MLTRKYIAGGSVTFKLRRTRRDEVRRNDGGKLYEEAAAGVASSDNVIAVSDAGTYVDSPPSQAAFGGPAQTLLRWRSATRAARVGDERAVVGNVGDRPRHVEKGLARVFETA